MRRFTKEKKLFNKVLVFALCEFDIPLHHTIHCSNAILAFNYFIATSGNIGQKWGGIVQVHRSGREEGM